MGKRALIIGLEYSGQDKITGCWNDVTEMKGHAQSAGYQVESITDQVTPLTRQEMMSRLQNFFGGAQAGDKLYLHYSGHGNLIPGTPLDTKGNPSNCIVPTDFRTAGTIDDLTLRRMIDQLPSGCSLIATLDCCHAETTFNLRFVYPSPDDLEVYSYPTTQATVVVLSASQDQQKSYGDQNGFFTSALDRIWERAGTSHKAIDLLGEIQSLVSTSRPCLSIGHTSDPSLVTFDL